MARRASQATGGAVIVTLATPEWWLIQQQQHKTFVRAAAARKTSHCPLTAHAAREKSILWYLREVKAAEEFLGGDVQTRQALVVDAALEEAHCTGIQWLLHIDIDELLYFPKVSQRRDARSNNASLSL